MAGFEVLIRPVVFPSIRPAPARILPPLDDPEQGKFVFSGGSVKTMGTSFTWSVNLSRQLPEEETKRVFDQERVYQMDENGTINKDNFIDVERLKKVRTEGGTAGEDASRVLYADPPKVDNVEVLQTDVLREANK